MNLKFAIKNILKTYLFNSKRGILGTIILFAFVILGIAGIFLTPYDPNSIVGAPYQPPDNKFIMGTDYFGRDIFSRLLVGTTYTLLVALIASSIIILIGVVIGSISGYYGGLLDEIFMRIVDVFMVIPSFFILIIVSAYLPMSNFTAALILGLLAWPVTSRIIRSQVLSTKNELYVDAAKVIGAGNYRIIIKHIMPNILPLIFISFISDLIYSVHSITTLIFLGLGDIRQPTWGESLYWAFATGALYRKAWWAFFFPLLFIILYSFGLILINDSVSSTTRKKTI
ncbi:MAG: ABC transporter permease [Thermoprotei archaeon]